VTARVYCHPPGEGWPREPEVLEEVPVRSCARRGRAVDLVLERGRHNRSQLVAQLQVRYPAVPIVFADSRKLAEDWTHRFLAAAAAHHRADEP
jgi:hypothetical protein